MNDDCISLVYVTNMKKTNSFQKLVKEIEKPKKETLKEFLLENRVIFDFYLFINIYVYEYKQVTGYEEEMKKYHLKDLSLYSYCNHKYYREIRNVLKYIVKYNLLNEDQLDIVIKILNRNKKEEI